MKVNKKYIKDLINNGVAQDITHLSFEDANRLTKKENGLIDMGCSVGTYGINGAIFKGRKSGKIYAINGRSTTLFQLI